MDNSVEETLFAAVAGRDWTVALDAVHALRNERGELAERARSVLVSAVADLMQETSPAIMDEQLERMLLLQRAGFLSLPDKTLDRIVEVLVLRNSQLPGRALRYARFRPDIDASRGVLAQFDAAGRSHDSDMEAGRITEVAGAHRVDGRRSLFRSRQESLLYQAAQRVFDDSLLVPNGALHAAIEVDAIRGLLAGDEKSLFFRVLVDLIVYEAAPPHKATHFIELDSPWHDAPEAEKRDRVKERMLGLAGCSLIRIRPHGQVGLDDMIELLRAAVATPGTGSTS